MKGSFGKPSNSSRPRSAFRGLRSWALAVGALAVSALGFLVLLAAPALARAPSHALIHGRGVTVPLPGGGGSLSATGALVILAVVAGVVAVGVVGWRYDRRRVERGAEPKAHTPAASKPLPVRGGGTAATVRARRQQGGSRRDTMV